MLSQILKRVETLKYSTETINILRLIRSENVGIKTFYNLINLYGSAEAALENISDLSLRGGKAKPIKIFSKKDAENEIDKVIAAGARIITYRDSLYPRSLKQIVDSPPVITVIGDTNLLNKRTIGIVGARNSSLNARIFTNQIAETVGRLGYIITSGLARGIDTAAHEGSLTTGTIAVIAGGIGNIYPPENEGLYNKIAEKGLIISELSIGSTPKAQHFPQRNRIISGLSKGIIVVEAGLKSGSLITARLALEQNREVLAVPGFPLDPRASGTNRLIKQGAYLIESIEDLIQTIQNFPEEETKFEEEKPQNFRIFNISPGENELKIARNIILELLSSCPIDLDVLFKQSKLNLPSFHIVMIELELAGKIIRSPGNKISLKFELK